MAFLNITRQETERFIEGYRLYAKRPHERVQEVRDRINSRAISLVVEVSAPPLSPELVPAAEEHASKTTFAGMEAVLLTKKEVTVSMILEAVCEYYGISLDALRGYRRADGLFDIRDMTMYLLDTLLKLSYQQMCNAIGPRSKQKIKQSVERIRFELKTVREVRQDHAEILKLILAK